MAGLKKAATLEKPAALQNYLLGKNYVVLTTSIPVGDIVEYALDWVVDIFALFNAALGDMYVDYDTRIIALKNKVNSLDTELTQLDIDIQNAHFITLGDYYELKFTHDCEISDKFGVICDPLQADIIHLEGQYSVLSDLVIELTKGTDAATYNFNISLVNLGGRLDNLESEVGTHKNIFQQIAMLINDPVKWGYELVDEIVTRFF